MEVCFSGLYLKKSCTNTLFMKSPGSFLHSWKSFLFFKKRAEIHLKRGKTRKKPIFFMNLLPSDGGGSIYPGPGGHV